MLQVHALASMMVTFGSPEIGTKSLKRKRQKGHCNLSNFLDADPLQKQWFAYSRTREYADRGPAVSKFLITVLRYTDSG